MSSHRFAPSHRFHALLACAATALLAASPLATFAQAQTARQSPPPKESARGILEEVVVTARRREENIQETPIAVTALSGDQLREQGITNISDLSKSVPSLQINSPNANQIYIRGIGERTGRTRIDPTVGVYLDGFYLPRSDGQLLDTVDIRSVQVLRGPQGTLFGKNTTGGALVLTLAKPHEAFQGYVEAALGNFEHRSLKAGVNMPVTDTFFTRLAVNHIKDEGFMKDRSGTRTSSNDRLSAVFQTRWAPSQDFTLDTLAFIERTREKFPGHNCQLADEDALFMRGLYVMWPGDTDPSNPSAWAESCRDNSRERIGDLRTNLDENHPLDKDHDSLLFSATAEWALSDTHSLKLVGGRLDGRLGPRSTFDGDGGPGKFNASYQPVSSYRDSTSVELQLTGHLFASRFNYTAGLFYMQENYDDAVMSYTGIAGLDSQTLFQLANGQQPTQPPPGGTTPFVGVLTGPLFLAEFELENTTEAVFFQGSYDLTENLQLTLGVRYTEETRRSDLLGTPSDRAAIAARISAHPLFGPPAGPFHPYLGPLGWDDDPVSIAAGLFRDENGDGIIEFPLDHANAKPDRKSRTFRETTPMLSLSYNLPQPWLQGGALNSAMIYATWSHGFKSGFFEPRGADGLQLIEPEKVENREIGFKLDAFDRSLRLNVAAYSMIFENMQLIQVQQDSEGNNAVVFNNAGEAKIEGGEIELTWLPLPSLSINTSYSFNNYEFTDFTDFDLKAQAISGERRAIDRSDEGFPVSPRHSASLGIQYRWQTALGTFIPRVDASYKSETFYGIDPGAWEAFKRDTRLAGQEAFTLIDARFTWRNTGEDLSIALYAKNLTDERHLNGSAAVADSLGTFVQTYGDPRRYGVLVRKTF